MSSLAGVASVSTHSAESSAPRSFTSTRAPTGSRGAPTRRQPTAATMRDTKEPRTCVPGLNSDIVAALTRNDEGIFPHCSWWRHPPHACGSGASALCAPDPPPASSPVDDAATTQNNWPWELVYRGDDGPRVARTVGGRAARRPARGPASAVRYERSPRPSGSRPPGRKHPGAHECIPEHQNTHRSMST